MECTIYFVIQIIVYRQGQTRQRAHMKILKKVFHLIDLIKTKIVHIRLVNNFLLHARNKSSDQTREDPVRPACVASCK